MLSAFKNFGITFLIAIVIFGIIAYFATGIITGTITDLLEDEREGLDEIIKKDTNDPDDPSNPVVPGTKIEGDSFNVLFITSNYRPELYNDYTPGRYSMYGMDFSDRDPLSVLGYLSKSYRKNLASSIVLLRVDKDRKEIVYSYFSPEIRVFTEYGYKSLGEILSLFGKDKVSDVVFMMTGCKMDYTVLIEGYNIDEFEQLAGQNYIELPATIYSNGTGYTFKYRRQETVVDEDGKKKTEYVQNNTILNTGEISLTGENFYYLLSAGEDSSSELSTKRDYVIEAVQRYYDHFISLDEYTLKSLIGQLITTYDQWYSLDEIVNRVQRPDGSVAYGSYNVNYPSGNMVNGTGVNGLSEPNEPIFITDFGLSDFYRIYDVMKSSSEFKKVIITVPCSYHSATEDVDSFFDINSEESIKAFMPYRKSAEAVSK